MAPLLPFRDINVHVSGSHYSFLSPSSPNSPTLVVDRPSGDLRLHDGKLLGARRISSIAGILGIIRLRLDKYIVVISKARPVGRIRGHMTYKVQETELLPLRERPLHDHDEDTYVALLKSMLKTGPMYFSYSIDITNSFQRQGQADLALPLWKRADDRFFWNRFIQSDLIDLRSGLATTAGYRHSQGPQPGADPYILPVIFGVLEIRPTTIKTTPLTYILITRRSRHRAGTRYFSRGIDEEGHVSNFNETEQTIVLNDSGNGGFGGRLGSDNKEMQVLSYVQTRGSVPVYWAEINTLKYIPKLQVRPIESSVRSAKLHFDEQIQTYGDNYLVNLVNQKGREIRIKEAYEQLVKIVVSSPREGVEADKITDEKLHVIEPKKEKSKYDRLHYVYFDFHNETKGLRWHRAQLLLQQLEQGLRADGYFRGVDYPGDADGRMEVRNRQTGVVRTNCMDCLDRTNVVQSMLGRYMLTRMLIDLGILREGDEISQELEFENLFRNIWADNADIVSKAYSGTGALKTDFTRTGNRTKAGMAQDLSNSCTRYVKNNFLDGPRQDAYDLFLGTYLPSTGGAGSNLIFVDRRPLFIQAMPYFLAASIFFVLVGSFARRDTSTAVWPFRLIMLVFLGIGAATFHFIWSHGTLFVNWPKLNTPPYAVEGYQDALDRVRTNPILGSTVARHERGKSIARLGFMEEGKKRIE
ncbi:putative phosphoinositide phosphatase [Eremomyces bilateralis CBS 781.70]|uniref:Phosphoinositide phosphatase n=1 Tax=Eremomyces bilateralis CBS 781.70 TaxID=1392243 RepID=A0A6G1GFF7_9PEZI|nr:putative phosphoinositide phosphatase [Eremomyces bilateralis CBS 781.70]KAF1816845.1 putative phosphoinositide phosphatase [Eremomyces bilateralis CBS 781.70]